MFGIFGSLTTLQKTLIFLVTSVGGLFVLVTVIYLFPSASNEGYMPEQPIPFSHKLHAGQMKMDCRYCHTGAYQGRHATIPPVETCMNCHRIVKVDSPHIQKLHEAYNTGKPIEWIRIHEVPDFAFFNHRPHVAAGVSCETCHGDIKSMEKVYQEEPLTMGWCKDCHEGQTTPLGVLKNIHPDLKNPRGEQVAPLNCTTCHY